MAKTIVVTDDTFEAEVLKAETPVLVDFWADWCGPCKMIAPVVEELADAYDGKMKFVKVDVDEQQKYAGQFGIRSIPTLLVFKDGRVVDQIIGAVPKGVLEGKVKEHIGES